MNEYFKKLYRIEFFVVVTRISAGIITNSRPFFLRRYWLKGELNFLDFYFFVYSIKSQVWIFHFLWQCIYFIFYYRWFPASYKACTPNSSREIWISANRSPRDWMVHQASSMFHFFFFRKRSHRTKVTSKNVLSGET